MSAADNVWEWCLNEIKDSTRIQLGGTGSQVVRGGSWDQNRDLARALPQRHRSARLRRQPKDFAGLESLAADAPERFHAGVLLYTGERALCFSERLWAIPVWDLWQGPPDVNT